MMHDEAKKVIGKRKLVGFDLPYRENVKELRN